MAFQKIGFIGLGLIGGSIALKLKEIHPDIQIIATAGRESTVRTAYNMGLISNAHKLPLFEFEDCDYIFLCAPTTFNKAYLAELKDIISDKTIITDVGSTKTEIHEEVIRLGMEKQFIGGHPMTGSEKIGIENAKAHLLENAYYIMTPTSQTPKAVQKEFYNFIKKIGALPLLLDYKTHDYSVASISHLPHMISFVLTNLVQEIDDPTETMKTMAAGSFRDMTRVAASSPVMWENICLSNKEPILDLMDKYIERFAVLRQWVADADEQKMLDYFSSAKEYRDSLAVPGMQVRKEYFELYVDLLDEAGSIAMVASLLAFKGINIKNIGIINNREFADGVLRVEFSNQTDLVTAEKILRERNYNIHIRI